MSISNTNVMILWWDSLFGLYHQKRVCVSPFNALLLWFRICTSHISTSVMSWLKKPSPPLWYQVKNIVACSNLSFLGYSVKSFKNPGAQFPTLQVLKNNFVKHWSWNLRKFVWQTCYAEESVLTDPCFNWSHQIVCNQRRASRVISLWILS